MQYANIDTRHAYLFEQRTYKMQPPSWCLSVHSVGLEATKVGRRHRLQRFIKRGRKSSVNYY
jgi:hypothetical protein